MSVWKRNAVVVAIVLFVGAAVYLNWSYNNQAEQTGEEPGRVLGEASLVNAQEEGQDGGASAQPNASASPAPSGTARPATLHPPASTGSRLGTTPWRCCSRRRRTLRRTRP